MNAAVRSEIGVLGAERGEINAAEIRKKLPERVVGHRREDADSARRCERRERRRPFEAASVRFQWSVISEDVEVPATSST